LMSLRRPRQWKLHLHLLLSQAFQKKHRQASLIVGLEFGASSLGAKLARLIRFLTFSMFNMCSCRQPM
jgi:hypothetical protein